MINYESAEKVIAKLRKEEFSFLENNCFTAACAISGAAYGINFEHIKIGGYKQIRDIARTKNLKSYEGFLKNYFRKHGFKETSRPAEFCPVLAKVKGKRTLCTFVNSGFFFLLRKGAIVVKDVEIVCCWGIE